MSASPCSGTSLTTSFGSCGCPGGQQVVPLHYYCSRSGPAVCRRLGSPPNIWPANAVPHCADHARHLRCIASQAFRQYWLHQVQAIVQNSSAHRTHDALLRWHNLRSIYVDIIGHWYCGLVSRLFAVGCKPLLAHLHIQSCGW